ncbi:hypothetical protein ACIP6P_26440 [Streptomyces sp. NPDC088729]
MAAQKTPEEIAEELRLAAERQAESTRRYAEELARLAREGQ